MNAASAVAVSFVLLILTRSHTAATARASPRIAWVDLAILTAGTAAAFWPNLKTSFVFDDYTHIVQTSHATWRILVDAFQREPSGYGLFFRPVGFVFYWIDYQWAGSHPIRWHLWSLAAHVVNTCLVYLLIRRLGMRRVAGFLGALLFGLHGSRAETVAWADARFDLLATLFALCALLAVLGYCRSGRRLFLIPIAVCTILAVYTKESAFCLPLLPLALLPGIPRVQWRRVVAASLALGSICAILFAYRWWALGGIGGYIDRTGTSAVWHSRPLHTLEALLFRQWAFLFFPVNWSARLEWWLRAAAAIFLAVLLVYAARTRPGRGRQLAGLAFLLAAALPIQHLLMFQSDFAGARVLYLPLAGFAIFWAALLDRSAENKLAWGMAAVLMVFNVAATEHNLRPWRAVPAAAAAVCREFGQDIAGDPRSAFVSGLPERLEGVYFLANGFPECVQMNSGQPSARVRVGGAGEALPPGARRFTWNAKTGRLELPSVPIPPSGTARR